MSEKQVLFFGNGNTAVFINEEQVPELQQPWLIKFVEFLEERFLTVKTESGWNWKI